MVWCHSFLVVQNKLFIRFMGFFFMFCSHVSSNLVSHGATVYSNLVFLWGGGGNSPSGTKLSSPRTEEQVDSLVTNHPEALHLWST